jgi:hypothetical protein
MKKYVKRLKEYEKISFDEKKIIEGMKKLKSSHRKLISVALEEDVLKELKEEAEIRDVPYEVLMRLLITDGLKRLKKVSQL